MLDMDALRVIIKFLCIISMVVFAGGFFGLCLMLTDKFCRDEAWKTYWDGVAFCSLAVFVICMAVKL